MYENSLVHEKENASIVCAFGSGLKEAYFVSLLLSLDANKSIVRCGNFS